MALINLVRVAALLFLIGAFFHVDDRFASALMVTPFGSSRQRWATNWFVDHCPPTTRRTITTTLYATPNNEDDTENDTNDSQSDDDAAMTDADLDQQKIALENMLKSGTGETDTPSSMNSSTLTSTRKQRLQREIELLKRLDPEHPDNNSDYSDVENQEIVVSELWSLWYGERGPVNDRKLRAIEETLGNADLWPEAENKYLELIREHCSIDGSMDKLRLFNWVEPANRLATLLFLMGRFKESKNWCDRILAVKPWHIGALSGVVIVCMRIGDKEGVLKYSMMGLPSLTPELRNARREWVENNVQIAENNLLQLEELNRKAYGEPDGSGENYVNNASSQQTSLMAESDQIEPETEDWQ